MNYNKCKNPVTKIYALVDPDTDEVRYIGASTDPELRLLNHLSDHYSDKGQWLNGLKEQGKTPK